MLVLYSELRLAAIAVAHSQLWRFDGDIAESLLAFPFHHLSRGKWFMGAMLFTIQSHFLLTSAIISNLSWASAICIVYGYYPSSHRRSHTRNDGEAGAGDIKLEIKSWDITTMCILHLLLLIFYKSSNFAARLEQWRRIVNRFEFWFFCFSQKKKCSLLPYKRVWTQSIVFFSSYFHVLRFFVFVRAQSRATEYAAWAHVDGFCQNRKCFCWNEVVCRIADLTSLVISFHSFQPSFSSLCRHIHQLKRFALNWNAFSNAIPKPVRCARQPRVRRKFMQFRVQLCHLKFFFCICSIIAGPATHHHHHSSFSRALLCAPKSKHKFSSSIKNVRIHRVREGSQCSKYLNISIKKQKKKEKNCKNRAQYCRSRYVLELHVTFASLDKGNIAFFDKSNEVERNLYAGLVTGYWWSQAKMDYFWFVVDCVIYRESCAKRMRMDVQITNESTQWISFASNRHKLRRTPKIYCDAWQPGRLWLLCVRARVRANWKFKNNLSLSRLKW